MKPGRPMVWERLKSLTVGQRVCLKVCLVKGETK
jgi:hypothetical protein